MLLNPRPTARIQKRLFSRPFEKEKNGDERARTVNLLRARRKQTRHNRVFTRNSVPSGLPSATRCNELQPDDAVFVIDFVMELGRRFTVDSETCTHGR